MIKKIFLSQNMYLLIFEVLFRVSSPEDLLNKLFCNNYTQHEDGSHQNYRLVRRIDYRKYPTYFLSDRCCVIVFTNFRAAPATNYGFSSSCLFIVK